MKFPAFLTLFLGAFVCVAIFTSGDYSLSWDEPTRWNSGNLKVDYYERLISEDDKLEVIRMSPHDLYPGLYDIPLAIARRSFPGNDVLLSRIWNVAFGILTILMTVLITRFLLRKFCQSLKPEIISIASVFSGVMLLAIPEFYGHIFINPKDVPFAAMYSLATFALLRLVGSFPEPRLGDYAFLGITTGLAMAMRPPGVIFIAYFGAVATLWCFVGEKKDGRLLGARGVLGFSWRGALVALLALIVLIPWWPRSHRNPFGASAQAVGELNNFSNTIPVLYDGQMYDAGTTPSSYVIWMFLVKMPEWILALFVIGLVLGLLWRTNLVALVRGNRHAVFLVGLTAFVVIFPVVYVFIKNSAIHNGYRHMLYVLPSACALGSLIWAVGMNRIWKDRRKRILGLVVTLLCLLYSFSINIRLHPYQYVYYNYLVGGTAGSLNKYETEYWYTSGKRALDEIIDYVGEAGEGSGNIRLFVSGPWQILEPYLPDGYFLSNDASDADFYIGNTQMRMDTILEGEEIIRIERMGLPICIVKKLREMR
ncbi:glycosyltransferase family 39 protein [Puniceicoccaceae bacterium K14]|nr:glycosyltransferase family 39 protein [Puniceicoccaceae bacterium K14]